MLLALQRRDWILLLAVACAVVWAFACDEGEPSERDSAQQEAPTRVQPEWQAARLTPGHSVHVGKLKLPCESCHDSGSAQFELPNMKACGACHAEQLAVRHDFKGAQAAFGGDAVSDCRSCHVFAPHGGATTASDDAVHPKAWDCTRCHSPQTSSGSHRIHGSVACAQCHNPHAKPANASIEPAGCLGCHAEQYASHGMANPTPQRAQGSPREVELGVARGCMQCHTQMHEATKDALAPCSGCHGPGAELEEAVKVGASALFPGHDACTSCHRPHQFAKTQAAACQSCHAGHTALAAATVPAHAACKNCHTPHSPRGSAALACGNCHQRIDNDHPAATKSSRRDGPACTTCHAAHPPSPKLAATASCSTCHTQASDDRSFHAAGLACAACHAPHRFELSKHDGCEQCHQTQLASVAKAQGHQPCEACHSGLPHEPGPIQPCSTCHAGQASRTHAGHARCDSCHEAHSGTLQTDCRSCHAMQASSAPRGHQRCADCHAIHEPSRVEASCTSCHASHVTRLHGNITGGCQSCHRAHGPGGVATPPACTSCHQQARLPALHRTPEHGQCGQCHAGHAKAPFAEPPICLNCHQAQKNHYPNAQRCSSCHLFRGL